MNQAETLRSRVYSYYGKNRDLGKKVTVAHFVSEGVSKSTIYDILSRCDSGESVLDRKRSGRPSKIFTPRAKSTLKRLVNHKAGHSQRKLASRFKCSQKLVYNVLKAMSISCWKKQTIPGRTDAQIKAARPKCAALYRKYRLKNWILDDESYFTLSHSSINGNDNFYSNNKQQAPASVKYRKKVKFEKKLLVWVAVSERGISKPYIVESGNAINQFVYRDECLCRRLLPFIKEHHSDNNYIFWPDLASSHYAEASLDFMIENLINHVDKLDNPANLPEVRPIEDFWALLKGKVYENGWEATNLVQLKRRILKCLREFDVGRIQALMGDVIGRVDYVRRYDVIEKR